MAHFNFVISQNAKWGHAGFYIDCHRMTVPENFLLQKSTVYIYNLQATLHYKCTTDTANKQLTYRNISIG